jgi:hypothetical protein
MRRPQIPANGRALSALSLCLGAALLGCSAGPQATGPATSAHAAPSSPAASATAAFAFTVAGNHPVPPNASQDTHAQVPEAACDSATFASDEAVGSEVADGFAVAKFPVAADLLTHFLRGSGTEVDYRPGSAISKKALASSGFRAVNAEVQDAVIGQLKAGRARVRLSAAQLPTVAFESTGSDLYWGFRGTQGLTVTGSGIRAGGRYTGTLSYVIRDSYGFPAGDTLGGFGPPMRYLQTACGAPQHAGGAHWFPDTISVTVPFSRAA